MPFFTEARVRQSYLEEIKAPWGAFIAGGADWLGSPIAALERNTILDEAMYGRQIPNPFLGGGIIGREPIDSPIVDAETARSRVAEFGLDLEIPPGGIPQRALEIQIERKREERVRQDTFDRGPTGFIPGALRIGAAFAASLLDPVNIASAFVPVVGQARYAAMLKGAGSSAIRRAGVRARVGAIEGTVGAALVEPIIYNAAVTEQADYDLLDSLTNVAFGGVLGGGLHITGGAIADTGVVQGVVRRFRRAPAPEAGPLERLLDAAAPETREALLRTAVARMAEGERVDVAALARLDPVLRGEVPGAAGGVGVDLGRLADEVTAGRTATGAPPTAPTAAAVPGAAPTEVTWDAVSLRARFTDASGTFDAGRFGEIEDEARAALAAGGKVTLFDEGKARPIVSVSRLGLVDKNGNPWGLLPLVLQKQGIAREKMDKLVITGPESTVSGIGRVAPAAQPARPAARAADTPIPAGQWSDVVANARLGAVSDMADVEASRAADASVAARSTDAQEARAVQDETDAALADIDHIVAADPVLKAAVDTEMAAADLTADAAAYGRAGEAMASCTLRRGVA